MAEPVFGLQTPDCPRASRAEQGSNSMTNRLLDWCFKKSIWVYHVNTGSCNGCDIEILDVLSPYYDCERFGIRLVHTPRHADALLVAGPVTRQVRERVLRLYDAVPD